MEPKVDIIDMAAIGDQDDITIFNAIGIRTFKAKSAEEVDRIIFNLVNQKCKIIYLSENLYQDLDETLEKYKSSPFPIIIPIPTSEENMGIGMKKIKSNVEKAIGIDIF
ncbi:MAG: V-type ATP synthase subunit F [Bacilli bacterium]|jgi:V/A-type H+-transporting ATPase subunit F